MLRSKLPGERRVDDVDARLEKKWVETREELRRLLAELVRTAARREANEEKKRKERERKKHEAEKARATSLKGKEREEERARK